MSCMEEIILVESPNKQQMKFNVDKCIVIHIAHKNFQCNCSMSNQQLSTTESKTRSSSHHHWTSSRGSEVSKRREKVQNSQPSTRLQWQHFQVQKQEMILPLYKSLVSRECALQFWGRIIKTLIKLQYSAPCISSYNMKATLCQQCCKSGSSKIYKFIVGGWLYVLLRRAHCSQHMANYNMEQSIRERVTNYSKSLFVVFHG